MKVEWEESDIKPGRRYGRPKTAELWIIGFLAGANSDIRYVSISLSDGMVTKPASLAGLAATLTEGGYQPEELLPKE